MSQPVATSPLSELPPPSPPATVKPRRRIGWIITVILLSLALLAALALAALVYLRLEEANTTIQEQEEIIDEKETFSLAMQELVATASQFDGVLFGDLVPTGRYESLANRGWDHRWNISALAADTSEVRKATEELTAVLATAQEQAAVNATGSTYEAVIDQLGGGFVTAVLDDTDTLCQSDVLGCVMSNDPYTVHFDIADNGAEWMTDFVRTGIAYHEFAHVLQMTNPEETSVAVEAFGGDRETMADCYALTYLPGWMLDHTIWVSDFQYWEISVGYGYTCDETQRQAIRDWNDSLGIETVAISQ